MLPQLTAMPSNIPPPPHQCNKHPCVQQDSNKDDEVNARKVTSSSTMQINTSSQVTLHLPDCSSHFLNVPTPKVMLLHSLTFDIGHIISFSLKTALAGALPLLTYSFPSFMKHNFSSSNVSSSSMQYLHLSPYVFLLLFILLHVLLASASAAFLFHSITINANGLSDPMKTLGSPLLVPAMVENGESLLELQGFWKTLGFRKNSLM